MAISVEVDSGYGVTVTGGSGSERINCSLTNPDSCLDLGDFGLPFPLLGLPKQSYNTFINIFQNILSF